MFVKVYIYENEIKKMNIIDLDFVGYIGLLIMRIVQLFRCVMWFVGFFFFLVKKYKGNIVLWRNFLNYLYLKLCNFDKKYLLSRIREIFINYLCFWQIYFKVFILGLKNRFFVIVVQFLNKIYQKKIKFKCDEMVIVDWNLFGEIYYKLV